MARAKKNAATARKATISSISPMRMMKTRR
jgi:hypothetical protein